MAKHRTPKSGKDFQKIPVERGPRQFLTSLLSLGVGFRIEGDNLIALGDGVSPLLQSEVTKRQAWLIPTLLDAGLQNGVQPRPYKKPEPAPDEPDKMQLIRNGIEGAQKQAARKKAMAQARRRKQYA